MNPLQEARDRYEVRTEKALAAAFNKLAPVTAANIGVIVPAAAEVRAALQEYETTLREILAGEALKHREHEDTEGLGWEILKGSVPCCPGDDAGLGYRTAQIEISDIIKSKYL